MVTASDTPAIALENVRFSRGPGAFTLGIDRLHVARGERVLLTGPSGAGKSTLIGLIAGTLEAEGRIAVSGTDMMALSPSARDRHRAEHIGLVFQTFHLLPYLGLVENVVLPLRFAPQRRARASGEAGGVEGAARRLLAALGLDTDALKRPVAALSTGQQQRVAVARALIGTPDIVLADEPSSALDRAHRDGFLDLLFAQVSAAGASLLMVSHETDIAARFTHTLALADIADITMIEAPVARSEVA